MDVETLTIEYLKIEFNELSNKINYLMDSKKLSH